MAALDSVVPAALLGLSDEQAREVKRAIGNVMGEIVSRLINPATNAFAELKPDESAWRQIAKERSTIRSSGGQATAVSTSAAQLGPL
jgi:hypothetical protein